MRTVWILNHYAVDPRVSPSGSRHYSLARHLPSNGWQGVVFAASTEHHVGRRRVTGLRVRRREHARGVDFVWVRALPYFGNGLSRIANMVSFSLLCLAPWMTRKVPEPDVVIGSSVHPLAAWAGLRLARRYDVPFVFEVRDLWPSTLIDMGRIEADSLAAKLLSVLESHLYRAAARIVTTMPFAVDYIRELGIDPSKVQWISNGTEVSDFLTVPQPHNSNFELMYLGSFGSANALDLIVRAFHEASSGPEAFPMRLRLIGAGPEKDALSKLVDDLGLGSTVSIEEAVPKDSVPELVAQADGLILTLLPLPLYRFGISLNKVFDYLAAGRPVLFAGRARGNPIASASAGICVDESSAGAIARAITEMVNSSPEQRMSWGRSGREYAEREFDYPVLSARLATLLDDISRSAP